MNAGEMLQQLIGAKVVSVEGTHDRSESDECLDFRIVTNKGALFGYVTNNEGIALEWNPS